MDQWPHWPLFYSAAGILFRFALKNLLLIVGATHLSWNASLLLGEAIEGIDGRFTAADRAYVFVSSQTTVGNMTGLTAGAAPAMVMPSRFCIHVHGQIGESVTQAQ